MTNYRKAVRISLPDAKIEKSIGDKFRHLEIESLECEVVSSNVINVKLIAQRDNQIFVEELTHITHRGNFTVWWQKDTSCYQCDKEAFGICECGKPICKLHSKIVKDQVFCKQCAKTSDEEEFQTFWVIYEKLVELMVKKTPLITCEICQDKAFVGDTSIDAQKFNEEALGYQDFGDKYDEYDEMFGNLSRSNQSRFQTEQNKYIDEISKKRAWLFRVSECPNGCKVCNKDSCSPEIIERFMDGNFKRAKYKCRVCSTIWDGRVYNEN